MLLVFMCVYITKITPLHKITKDIIYDLGLKMVIKVNAYFAEHQKMIDEFIKHL